MTSGYSGTPLSKKLGIKEGAVVLPIDVPADYMSLLDPLPANVAFDSSAHPGIDIVHLFVTCKFEMQIRLEHLRKSLRPDAAIWVSWPKKAARVPTDITEGTIREVALPMGFVDIKVCAVSEVWSGLKLVVRKERR